MGQRGPNKTNFIPRALLPRQLLHRELEARPYLLDAGIGRLVDQLPLGSDDTILSVVFPYDTDCRGAWGAGIPNQALQHEG